MKKRILLRAFLLMAISSFVINSTYAQVFSGSKPFEKLIEFEGQRYLMTEIYQIEGNDIDKLKIDKTIQETDGQEGFLFVLTSYAFNEKRGVIISSFNSVTFDHSKKLFSNIHLSNEEFLQLNEMLNSMKTKKVKKQEHFLKRFNERIILDVNKIGEDLVYTLWIDNHNRHSFTFNKWDRAVKRYLKFVDKSE